MEDSKKFYFGKQEDYSKYRPDYPKVLFDTVCSKYGLNSSSSVVELGAGTGKFSKIMSDYCDKIYSVEPNLDMLKQGKLYCSSKDNVFFINSCAEDTKLDDNSADFVFAVQSFHWFLKDKLKIELKRIMKKDGFFAIVWNNLEDDNNLFSKEYFNYINEWKYKLTGFNYQHKNINERECIFKDKKFDSYDFVFKKEYDLDMLIGFSNSLSFVKNNDDESYSLFIDGIKDIFSKYQNNNKVCFDLHTEMYIGKIF